MTNVQKPTISVTGVILIEKAQDVDSRATTKVWIEVMTGIVLQLQSGKS